jgi:intracellular septation protein
MHPSAPDPALGPPALGAPALGKSTADATEAAVASEKTKPQPAENSGLKLLLDLVPLAIFFVAFRFLGLVPATALLVVATLLSVLASKVLLGKVSPMLIVSAVLVTVFGGLTIALDDPRFIKMKPTIVNLLFAGVLSFGLLTGRNFLKFVLGEALHLTTAGWHQLTLRWIGLFVSMALLNEYVWRTWNTPETEHVWVNFKFPGMLLLTIAFTAAQLPLMRRHADARKDI